ncbi:hypothetical protein M0805_008427 [Coniferiporia weirii]|nr:hypothetical protein M0805_008427 [Coniferiporia weirii]
MASSSSSLQRGKACIRCRRRKIVGISYTRDLLQDDLTYFQRCDSARPVCTPCVGANRSDDCEYTDNQGRTRTQILEENVSRLEARLQELENPDISAQTILLSNPYDANTSAADIAGHLAQAFLAPVPASLPAVMNWWEFEEPPAQVIDMLVALFLPHATVLGFALSPERFGNALRLPMLHPARPHPALLHAVFLWGLRLSNVPDLIQHEGLYLQRTILALQDALGGGGSILERPAVAQRRVHAVQASLLLAQYFFTLGRLLEGRYHANAAVALAVSCRMHRITSASTTADPTPAQTGSLAQEASLLELAPARDSVELGERVRVFWAAYSIDRCWSVALNAPCTLTDDASFGTQILTPWPRELGQYEQIANLPIAFAPDLRNGTVHHFVFGHSAQAHNDRADSYAALRAKGSAIYERASSLSRSIQIEGGQRAPENLRAEIEALAHTTAQFANELTPLDRLDIGAHITEARQSLMVVHSLAHAAMIQLHAVTSATPEGELGVSAASLEHAREIDMILELATNGEVVTETQQGSAAASPVLDPILSITGMSAARTFLQEYHRMRLGPYTHISRGQMESYRTSVGQIIGVLRRAAGIANNYPIFCEHS